jgi:vitamin B12/bleomycin/antimicrobial peptide transport system ATP-binding/permease protein
LHSLRTAWRLSKNYWSSEDKWPAWGLLLAVLSLNLANVYVSVRINEWNYHFYNALQSFKSDDLLWQLALFCVLVALAIGLWIYAVYLKQLLQLRWRGWLTDRYLKDWLANRAYYHLELGTAADNPDQRISEDVDHFTMFFLNLFFGLISSAVSLVSFLVILWGLSGSADIPLGAWRTIHIPAYLFWAALIYAIAGTWLTLKIGRRLISLNYAQQRYEADFRFSLVRLRENAESIAFYQGEPVELNNFHDRFNSIAKNVLDIMKRQRFLTGFTMGYNQVATIFPLVVVSPRYFAKQIGWGGLMQVVNAFSFVQNSLSFIVNSYSEIAVWQSTTQRLSVFEDQLRTTQQATRGNAPIVVQRDRKGLVINHLDLNLPNGTPLLRGVKLSVAPRKSLLITGPAGSGKSTLLRAIAGIWPFGAGDISLGRGRMLFLPQRPYMPLGTLANALLYPMERNSPGFDEGRLANALDEVGLGFLIRELWKVENWTRRLSLGEQQRLAFARVLLIRPAFLFMDEATAALDEPAEADLLALLRQSSWRPTLLSVGHRQTLVALHDRTIDLSVFRPGVQKLQHSSSLAL